MRTVGELRRFRKSRVTSLQLVGPVAAAFTAIAAMFVAVLWISHAGGADIDEREEELARILGALAVFATSVVGWLLVRTVKRQVRLADEHAHELESFAGRVAHDLRSPLGTIALRVDCMLSRQTYDQAAFECLSRSIARMDQLLEGLLEFARAGAKPVVRSTSLRCIVDSVVTDASLHAQRARAELSIDPIPDVMVGASPGALASVLSNLLDNATKYIVETSGPRRIVLRASELPNAVHVDVEDTGPGLPIGAEAAVFEPFHRIGNSSQPGLGLGLATVKKLVESFGGTVGVTRNPHHGSTFWFELPTVSRDAPPV